VTGRPAEVVEELVEAYNAKSLERVLALYRPDARFWDPFHREGVVGRDAIGEVIRGLFDSYPDEQMAITALAADETHAVAEFRSTGTTKAGSPFELEFTEVYELKGEQVASCRVYIDTRAVPT
jgi:ketosteroid isomerase-like protein